ncbi:hypothetical protein Pmani_035280 [Petrolisthes manimaculis]|uniref:Uncharacterized protein n=1 Tax=Petrolisthes manimaculis TaxID=1843537 RepID=A0AAE1NMP8_9EUCA|nr:hypothetical protein Pmani_035280 [Petrolisthes manimaculis]
MTTQTASHHMCRDGYHYEAPVNDCQNKEQRSEEYKHIGVAVIPIFRLAHPRLIRWCGFHFEVRAERVVEVRVEGSIFALPPGHARGGVPAGSEGPAGVRASTPGGWQEGGKQTSK